MKSIFLKINFPESPNGNLYEWEKAETKFKISEEGLYTIKIVASAKNAKQNNSTDDDDLRIALDGFNFGKYEIHDEKISWKGFGTSASWDGASLKGGTKRIYFFIELDKGEHKIQFFADETPQIESVEVFKIENNDFKLNNLNPPENIESKQKGIPWLSFVFVGTHAKNILLDVDTKSAKEKNKTDGDNLKVIVNGKILQNEKASSSRKYKNFYFSGDIKSTGILSINDENLSNPLAFENSIELWYDQEPVINSIQIGFFDAKKFLEELDLLNYLSNYILNVANLSRIHFKITGRTYSRKFLDHALEPNPSNLIFKSNHPIVKKIKADPVYEKIRELIKEKLDAGIMEGQINPSDLVFESFDLDYSIHGIKKIDFKITRNEAGNCEVNFVLYDIYDFVRGDAPSIFKIGDYFKQQAVNMLDTGEKLDIISNFEIQVNLKDIFLQQ